MAKVKVTELTEATISAEDIIEFVDDPSGTPTSKRDTIQGILDLVPAAESSPSIFDATVGATGADYETISEALAASKKTLLVIDDVTEIADCAVPSTGLEIYIAPGQNLDMATFHFTFAEAAEIFIKGMGVDSRLTYNTSGGELMTTSTLTDAVVRVEDITIDNNSTASSTSLADRDCVQKIKNVTFELPNDSSFPGLYFKNVLSYARDVHFIGGGQSCAGAMYVLAGTVDGCRISGSWDNANIITSTAVNVHDITFNNIYVEDITTPGNSYLELSGMVSNVAIVDSDNTIIIECNFNGSFFSNIKSLSIGMFDLNAKTGVTLNNVVTAGAILLDGADFKASNIEGSVINISAIGQATNIKSNGTISISSTYSFITNLISANSVTITGDYNRIIGGKIGATGGAYNLVLNSEADNNRIIELITDAAASDSGAGNTIEEVVI